MKEKKIIEFECIADKCVYAKNGFKIYSVIVDKEKFPNIKRNQYENVSILGGMPTLLDLQPYNVAAEEDEGRFGPQYKVVRIDKINQKTEDDALAFLSEILTFNQAKELWKHYPDIIDRVVHNRLDDVDLSKLHGIGEHIFSIIKDKIKENYVLYDMVLEFGGVLTFNMIKKLYDKYGSVDLIKEKLNSEPYQCLTRISGVGFIKADQILLDLEKADKIKFKTDLKTSCSRCMACIEYLLQKNEENGHTKMDLRELRDQVMRMTPACSEHYVTCIKSDTIYYNRDTFDIALKSTYIKELYIACKIIEGLHYNKKWSIDWKKYVIVDGCELSKEQQKALQMVCENNIMIINGFAGSGKSFTLHAIINMLDDNNKTYQLMAPTGRAAKVLSDYTGQEATTIHRGLLYRPPIWEYNEENQLICDVVIVDEFSMTDVDLCKHLIDAINFNHTKLIIVGDSAQLPSVGCGNLLHDFIKSKTIPSVTLNHIFRYSEGGLMKVATDVRNTTQYLHNIDKKVTPFGNGDYVFISSNNEQILEDLLYVYKRLIDRGTKPEDIQILSAYNKGNYGTVEINRRLHLIANPKARESSCTKITVGEETFYVDDIVIQKKNNYKAELFVDDDFKSNDFKTNKILQTFIPNGMIGRIISVTVDRIVIDFDGDLVQYKKSDMYNVKLAYAISTHSSQGGSAQIIILITPSAHTFMLNSNLIYVGLTRMKKQCFHIGDATTVNRAIRKKENFNRKTFMEDFLNSKNKEREYKIPLDTNEHE